MEIVGYVLSILIGVSLGLVGGGGSILTVPLLVYLFGVPATQATVYSLLIVGSTSLVGAVGYFRQGLIDLRTALLFGIPSVISVLLTRKVLVPLLPEVIYASGDFKITQDAFLLLLFALLMLGAAYNMIFHKRCEDCDENEEPEPIQHPSRHLLLMLQGVVVGLVTGLVGAGGGFLIIPALVMFSGLHMKEAVATSLFIVTINSLIGFLGTLGAFPMDWNLLIPICLLAIVGIFGGMALSKRIPGAKLKPAFGWFVLVMAVYILSQELL